MPRSASTRAVLLSDPGDLLSPSDSGITAIDPAVRVFADPSPAYRSPTPTPPPTASAAASAAPVTPVASVKPATAPRPTPARVVDPWHHGLLEFLANLYIVLAGLLLVGGAVVSVGVYLGWRIPGVGPEVTSGNPLLALRWFLGGVLAAVPAATLGGGLRVLVAIARNLRWLRLGVLDPRRAE